MHGRFTPLFRRHTDALARAWVDALYADRRTRLTSLLSYRQLVEHLPELFDELARLLDEGAPHGEVLEAAGRFRHHAQARFQQRALIDEVARELITLRQVVSDFLWRSGSEATAGGDIRVPREALWRADTFIDELIVQAILIYAASLRPSVQTRTPTWPPPRRRRTD